MAKLDKSLKREQHQRKARHGMRVNGKGFIHIQNSILKRARRSHAKDTRTS